MCINIVTKTSAGNSLFVLICREHHITHSDKNSRLDFALQVRETTAGREHFDFCYATYVDVLIICISVYVITLRFNI